MTDHSGRTHSVYSASGSHRWMKCYGSIQRAAGMPEGLASSYALDGEEAHELLEYALSHQYRSAHDALLNASPPIHWEHRHDNEETRLESVQDALDFIQDLIDAYQPDLTVYLETQFIFPTEHQDDAGGTSDVTIFVPDLDMMIVADFKHGSGVAVDVVENSQLMFYAVGSRQELRRQGLCNSGKTVYRMVIMQPRGFHQSGTIREWYCGDERLDRFIGEVSFAIRKTKEAIPEIKPGKYCRWCKAVSACPEAERYRMEMILPTYKDVNTLRQTGLPNPEGLSAQHLGDLLSARDMVYEWFEAVFKQALALARQGVAIPGKKLVLAQARSKWNGADDVVAQHLQAISGLHASQFLENKLTTITNAKALIKAVIYEQVDDKRKAKKLVEQANLAIAQLTIKDTSGNLVLVDREDKRPEINTATLIEFHPPKTT